MFMTLITWHHWMWCRINVQGPKEASECARYDSHSLSNNKIETSPDKPCRHERVLMHVRHYKPALLPAAQLEFNNSS